MEVGADPLPPFPLDGSTHFVLQATDGFVAERDALSGQLLVVGQQMVLTDQQPHRWSPGEAEEDHQIGGQLQLPLQAAQQLLSPAVAGRYGFILPRFGRQCIYLRRTCL